MKAVPERQSVQVGGATAGYWHVPAPAGSPRLLFIHGLGASNHIWEPLARALPEGLELFALDLPGSGASPPRGALGPPELALFVLEFLGALGLSAVDLVAGHSLGGAVALELGLVAPARVGGLLIFNAAPALPWLTRLGLRAPGMERLMSLPGVMPRPRGPTRFFTQLYLSAIFGERGRVTDEVVDGYSRLAHDPQYFANMAATVQGFARHRRSLTELTRLTLPISVVWGERDPVFPVSLAERLVRVLPGATLHRLPRVGHCPPQEDPTLVAALTTELLGRVRRAAATRPRPASPR